MVTNNTMVDGTDKDPQLIERAGVALTLVTEDNLDRLMIDLEQSQKSVSQLKETLKKERDESHKLKRKYEDMTREVKVSMAECQTLQADKDAGNICIKYKEELPSYLGRVTKSMVGELEFKD